MTGWVTGIRINVFGTEKEEQYHPPPDDVRVYVTMDEIQPDRDGADIEFHITKEGLIINVTDLHGEVVGTSSQTFEELTAELVGVE
jgi:hypothetical protein